MRRGFSLKKGDSWFRSRGLYLLTVLLSALPLFAATQDHVTVLTLKGVIAPFMAQYINRGIEQAERHGAKAVIIQMDTPGGLMNSMDDIIQKILNSRVPVVVYVSPPGARAGSAGVFITMAAHVAAMAPTTNIGAAHPVSGRGEDIQQDLRDKITNDAVARVRALADARGRNAEWAEAAVRKSVSITADQALQQRVIELIAGDLEELLAKIDGRSVNTPTGKLTLATKEARREHIEMSWSERFLHTITDPNIAYVLLNLGIIGLIAELYNPGLIMPGLAGLISLVLAFTAFGVLEPNWAGLGLIVLAAILFLADLKVQGHALTVFGVIAFVLGSILLFKPMTPTFPGLPKFSVSPWVIGIMTAIWVGFFVIALSATLRAHRAKLSSGVDTLLGAVGIAKTDLSPTGIVLVHSEDWSAEAVGEAIQKGDKVKILEIVEGLRLKVTKALS